MTWYAVDIFGSEVSKHWSTSALIFAPWLFSKSRELSTPRVYIREMFHFAELNCIRITSISAEPWTKQVSVAVFRKFNARFLFLIFPFFWCLAYTSSLLHADGGRDNVFKQTKVTALQIITYSHFPHFNKVCLTHNTDSGLVGGTFTLQVEFCASWNWVSTSSAVYTRQSRRYTNSQHTGTWSAAAWSPRRLCYRPAVFFRCLRFIALHSRKLKLGALFWNVLLNFSILKFV